MLNYKNHLIELLKDNKEVIKEYAYKVGLINEEPIDLYQSLESRCYRALADYDSLIIHGIDGEPEHMKKLYDRFKDDARVSFWISSQMKEEQVLSPERESVWVVNNEVSNSYARPIFDYGDYRVLEKGKQLNRFVLLDDKGLTEAIEGYTSGYKKEKNLCKIVAKFLKDNKELTILTFEEKSLLYIKGLMKGADVLNRSVTFAFIEGYQDSLLKSFKSELYNVTPIVTVEGDFNWSLLENKYRKFETKLMSELRNYKNSKK